LNRYFSMKVTGLFWVFCFFIWSNAQPVSEPKVIVNEEQSFSFRIVNDNYKATFLPGEDGNYFGADDFLTYSLLARYKKARSSYAFSFSSITSNYFSYRFDIISLSFSETFHFKSFKIQPTYGLSFKGDFGGQAIQNKYHSLAKLGKIKLPYSKDKKLALYTSIEILKSHAKNIFQHDKIKYSVRLQLATGITPSRINPYFSYSWQTELSAFMVEALVGYHYEFNEVKEYSNLSDEGFIGGLSFNFKIFETLSFDLGFITTPSKNIVHYDTLKKYKHSYLPQAWIGF